MEWTLSWIFCGCGKTPWPKVSGGSIISLPHHRLSLKELRGKNLEEETEADAIEEWCLCGLRSLWSYITQDYLPGGSIIYNCRNSITSVINQKNILKTSPQANPLGTFVCNWNLSSKWLSLVWNWQKLIRGHTHTLLYLRVQNAHYHSSSCIL